MTLEELKQKAEFKNAVYADFSNFKNLNFCGVYVLYDTAQEDKIVYVGSSYAKGVSERMSRHKSVSESNNLARAIIKKDDDINGISDRSEQLKAAVERIKTFKIMAAKLEDLEYQIIKSTNPKYNKNGNK